MMPFRLSRILNQSVALDNRAAKIAGAWYDDEDWVLRYCTILFRERALILPVTWMEVDQWQRPSVYPLATDLRVLMDQVPAIAEEGGSLTRREELSILNSFGDPVYWGGTKLWGDSMRPFRAGLGRLQFGEAPSLPPHTEGQTTRVFSMRPLFGTELCCVDGSCGVIDDMLLDGETWAVRYFIAVLREFIDDQPSYREERLISPFWVTSWADQPRAMCLPFTTDVVQTSPAYRPEVICPKDESVLARHYGLARNW